MGGLRRLVPAAGSGQGARLTSRVPSDGRRRRDRAGTERLHRLDHVPVRCVFRRLVTDVDTALDSAALARLN